MKPIGPLMIEHRLIERMIALLEKEWERIAGGEAPRPDFLSAAADFFREYADRLHHGKEEDILFRDLEKKEMSPEDRRLMAELIDDHARARRLVGALAEAVGEKGAEAIRTIENALRELVALYPAHIAKEDGRFFPAAMEYLDGPAQAAMLEQFNEFDRKLIHERYREAVEGWEKS